MTLLGSKSDVDDICSLGFGGHLWFRLRCMTSSGGNNDDSSSDYQAKPGYGEFPSLPPEGYGVSRPKRSLHLKFPDIPLPTSSTRVTHRRRTTPPAIRLSRVELVNQTHICRRRPSVHLINTRPINISNPDNMDRLSTVSRRTRTVNRINSRAGTHRRCGRSVPMVWQLHRWLCRLRAVAFTVSAESSGSFWELSRSIRSSRQVKRDAVLRLPELRSERLSWRSLP